MYDVSSDRHSAEDCVAARAAHNNSVIRLGSALRAPRTRRLYGWIFLCLCIWSLQFCVARRVNPHQHTASASLHEVEVAESKNNASEGRAKAFLRLQVQNGTVQKPDVQTSDGLSDTDKFLPETTGIKEHHAQVDSTTKVLAPQRSNFRQVSKHQGVETNLPGSYGMFSSLQGATDIPSASPSLADSKDNASSSYDRGNRNRFERVFPKNSSQLFPQSYGLGHSVLWRSIGLWHCVGIILWSTAVYAAQICVDRRGERQFKFHNRISTCLLFGASFRDLGETALVFLARLFTSGFIHAGLFHYLSNIIGLAAATLFLMHCFQLDPSIVWFGHWIFFIFLVCAMTKTLWSHYTRLYAVGLSLGSSGGSVGLCAAIWVFGAVVVPIRDTWTYHILLGVVRIFCGLMLLKEPVDTPAMFAALLVGCSFGLGAAVTAGAMNPGTLAHIGNICSVVALELTAIAYLEVIKESVMDGRELVVRAYVKWLHLEETLRSDHRHPGRRTAHARLNCERLTEDFLFLLEHDNTAKSSHSVLQRLEQECKHIRKSLPELGGHLC